MLIGREPEKRIITRLKEKNLLTGGFLFFGDDQTGKFAFAEELTAGFENNPTVCGERMIISPSESKIGIDEIREIKKFLMLRPVMSKFRAVIISPADKMTPEAQNAALKIVEEPPAYALIILIARGAESLLPTLVSRLKRIYFPKVKEDEIVSWLTEKGHDEKLAARAARLSFGRPGFALELAERTYPELIEEKRKAASVNWRLPEIPKKFASEEEYGEFMKISLSLLYNNKHKNYPLLKKILMRMELSSKFNTNKKLQLQSIPWIR